MRILKNCIVHSFLVGLMTMAFLLCCSSHVQAAQSGDYTYTVTDGKAEITKYIGAGGDVTVPSTLDGDPVTSIGNEAFRECTGVTTISIPQGVTSIGEAAFWNCSGLTAINIPQGVENINSWVFMGCTSLTSISIPQGVTNIGVLAFNECIGLTSISIPQGVTSIGYRAFYGCTGLTSISIPEGVISISSDTFSGCTGLTSIIIPEGVTSIGDQAFYYCTGLTSISLPQGVTSIGNFAFASCIGLTTISIPQGVTSIGYYAFSDCTGLTTISIPQGVTSIGEAAFDYCSGLTSIRFNSATTTIYDSGDTIPAETKIIGYDQSTARNYATKYGRSFQVIDTSNTLQSIAITTPATKLIYGIGDELDIAGLVISGIYNDGNTTPVAITVANVTGFNSAVEATDQVLTITVGTKTTTYTVQIVNQIPSLTYENSTIDTTNKIVILTFSDTVVNNNTDLDDLKSAITFASNGLTFAALGVNDTVAINGNTLVVTFNTALAGSINKLKVAANSIRDTAGNVLDTDVITEPIVASVNLGEVVNIPDQSLLAVVRNSLNKPTGDINVSDILNLTDLEASDKGISDLTGLEYASNLRNLDLKNNQITTITAIAGLTGLENLDFGGNQVTDISALANLNNLKTLSLWGNHVNSITPFQNKPNIEELHIDNIGINNISVLAGMNKLKSLWASGNQISDLSPLSDKTSILDLQINNNEISNISVLVNLTNLQTLNVCNNHLTEISVVAGMPDLTQFDFGGNQVSDIAPLAGLNKLEELKFWGNPVAEGDISVISGKTSIRNLHIDGINASDLSPVATLSNLEIFWANMNQISDLSPLANLSKLNNLSLHSNRITDISALVNNSGFAEGTNINLENNPLSNQAKVDIQTLLNRGVNVSYDLPEIIVGCVRTPDGDPFTPSNNSNAYVKIRRLDGKGYDLAGARINSDGTFSLKGDIPTGDYSLRADANGNNNPYANAIPVKVHLVAGQTISQDISLTSPLITGKVLKPGGSVFAPGNDSYVFVKLRGQNGGEDICDTGVNNDGSFRLGGDIPTGDYLLMADAKGSNNPYSNAIYVTVHLVTGETTTQDISLTIPMITGKILKPDGNPFVPGNDSNGRVVLGDANGKEITDTNIKDDGTYELGGVIQSGQYKLWVDIWGNNNPYSRPTPLTITVTLGTVLTQDITLTNPIITGRVLNPDGSVFTPGNDSNVYVKLRRQDNSGDDLCGSGVNNDGSFKLGGDIPTGDYLLMVDANGNNNSFTNAKPVTIHVTAGQTTTQDISLTNPLITGRVLKPDGSAFIPGDDSWVDVCLRYPDNNETWTGINSEGIFKFGGAISTGAYTLYAYPKGINNLYTGSIPVTIHVTGQIVAQNISLTSPIIIGKVRKPDGTEFTLGDNRRDSDVWVRVRMPNNSGEDLSRTQVNSDGSFKLGGNIPEGSYLLVADACGSANPYASAIPVIIHVPTGGILEQNISLTNPLITGRVLQPDGSVFVPGNDSYVYVKLRRQDDSGDDICGTGVNDDGSFRLGGDILTGDYLLMADANGSNNQYADAIPVIVHVTAGQTTSRDISLTNPIIKGRILKPDGSPFLRGNGSDGRVVLRDINGNEITDSNIEDNGTYKLGGGIQSGQYQLCADVWGNNNPYSRPIPLTITITLGTVLTQDITLTNPLITGKVLKPDGSVFTPGNDSYVYVKLRRQDNSGDDLCGSGVNNDGSFKLGGDILTGDYLLMADANGSNNPYADATPITIHVTAGQLISQDISLTNPIITGKILKPDGSAYVPGQDSWIDVCLKSSNGWDYWTGVNDDGSFRYGGDIPSGEYTLYGYARGKNNPFTRSVPITINVVSSQQVVCDITLTNPIIIGKVLKPDGYPYAPWNYSNVYVVLRRQDNSGDDLCGTGVNDDGSFRLGGDIPTGDYLLKAYAYGINNPYANAITVNVHLVAGQTTSKDISLTNPIIIGRVLKPGGSVFTPGNNSKVNVVLRRQDNSGDDLCGTGVNDDGSFRLGGNILTGDYMLMAYANGSNNSYANAIPLSVHITLGQLLEKDISLTNPVVTGKIFKPGGDAYIPGQDSWVVVCLRSSNGWEKWTGVYGDGLFRFGGDIPAGDYTLHTYPQGRNNTYSNSIPKTITVVSDQHKAYDLTLTNPKITGKVFMPNGSVFTPGSDSNVHVKLRRPDNTGDDLCDAFLNDDGSFRLGGDIPPGDYLLRADVRGSNNLYANAIPLTVKITAGQLLTQNISLTILNYSATPLIQIGINPDVGGSAGIYVGLKDIKDTQSNVVPNVKLAGYQIEVDYDPSEVAILDVVDEAHLGQFIYSVEIDLVAGKGKVLVADAGANGTTNSSKLFFLPINLKGSALDLSSLQVKYLSVSDVNLRQIKIDPVDLEFHRGKIYNEGSAIQPNISDAVAGLQFLAGLIDVGTNLEQVNPINMASIVGPDPDSTIVKPNVKDVIALMQYLVGLRDINFDNSGDILIGGNLELTGDLSIFGKPAKNAIELAFQQVNDQGGILNGRKFKLIAQDNKSVDNEVVTAATKLIEQAKVVGIIGPLTTGGTRAEIPVAIENSVPVITPSGSAPILTVNENGQLNQWIFRACFIDPVQAKAAAKFALGLKISAETTAAIISNQNDGYSQALAAAFGQSFTNGGGEIVDQELQEHYSDGSDNYSTILAKIKLTEPDVVYLPGYYQEAGKIIKRARELGMNMPFIGGDGWANPDIYNIAGVQAMNNTYYTDHVALDDPAMTQFITDYQAKYGEMPDAWPALAFDAAKMFIKAIELAGSTDTEKIRVALENLTDLQGVCGNITVDPLTHNPVRNVVVMENKEGKAVFLAKIVPN